MSALASARVQPSTGLLSAAIPFELPRARGSSQPELELGYNSSGGVGVGGLGWSLNLPSIERHNPSGPPQFNDPATGWPVDPKQQDRFTFGGEPLVLVCFIPAGGACIYTGTAPANEGHTGRNQLLPGEQLPSQIAHDGGWHYYRLATEAGALLRFFWSPDHSQWLVQGKGGETSIYGVPSDGDVTGTDRDANNHIFRWNLVQRYDTQRNAGGVPTNPIIYQWTPMGPNQSIGTQLGYLTDIFDTPPLNSPAPTPATFAHHTHLVYDQLLPNPAFTAPVWRVRPVRGLTRVDVTSQDFAAQGTRQQVRRYFLRYTGTAQPSVYSVQLFGNCATANNAEDKTTSLLPDPTAPTSCAPPHQPSTTFLYQEAAPMTVTALTADQPPTPIDFNSDGLPDLLASNTTVLLNSVVTDKTFTPAPYTNTGSVLGSGAGYTNGVFGMEGTLETISWVTNPNQITSIPDVCVQRSTSRYAFDTGSGTWMSTPLGLGCFNLSRHYPVPALVDPSTGQFNFWSDSKYLGDEQPYVALDVDGDGIQDLFTSSLWGQNYSIGGGALMAAHRELGVRFSKRGLDGSYAPFFGSNAPAATTPHRVDACMGGVNLEFMLDNGWDRNAPSGYTLEPVLPAARTMGDLDGDGMPDFVQLDRRDEAAAGTVIHDNQLRWWPGHGDGVFGECANNLPRQCTCDRASGNTVYVQLANGDSLANGSIDDVNGDGLGDLVTVTQGGVNVYLNSGGNTVEFQPPISIAVASMLGWPIPTTSPAGPGWGSTVQFADMNGSGVADIIYTQPGIKNGFGNGVATIDVVGGVRPGALTTILSENGVKTSITYDSTPHLALLARQASAPWTTSSPQVVHVVTSITTSALFGDSYTTSYTYRDPIYDGRDSAFLGFRNVVETTPGDANTAMSTATTFFYAACGGQNPRACVTSLDDVQHSYRGLPVLTEVYSGTNARQDGIIVTPMALSTTHHSYAEATLYVGSDDRTVRRIYDAETDSYLYDTSPYVPAAHTLTRVSPFRRGVKRAEPAGRSGSFHGSNPHQTRPCPPLLFAVCAPFGKRPSALA